MTSKGTSRKGTRLNESPAPPPCAKGQEVSIKPPRMLCNITLGIQTIAALTLQETKISGCLIGHVESANALEDTGFRVSTAFKESHLLVSEKTELEVILSKSYPSSIKKE